MILLAMLAAALASPPSPPVDTVAAYATVLRDVRAALPGAPVALADSQSVLECTPWCDHPDLPTVSRRTVEVLQQRGLLQAICPRSPSGALGCDTPLRGEVVVALGRLRSDPLDLRRYPHPEFRTWPQRPGDEWVDVMTIPPCPECRGPEVTVTRYFLRPHGCGGWTILHRSPVWGT